MHFDFVPQCKKTFYDTFVHQLIFMIQLKKSCRYIPIWAGFWKIWKIPAFQPLRKLLKSEINNFNKYSLYFQIISKSFEQFHFQSDCITHVMYPAIKSRFIFGCPMGSPLGFFLLVRHTVFMGNPGFPHMYKDELKSH